MKLRIVEWSQSLYEDMAERCWTIVDESGRDVAGTFWNQVEAEDYMCAMGTPDEIQHAVIDGVPTTITRYVPDHHDPREQERERDEAALRQADPTVRYPEGI